MDAYEQALADIVAKRNGTAAPAEQPAPAPAVEPPAVMTSPGNEGLVDDVSNVKELKEPIDSETGQSALTATGAPGGRTPAQVGALYDDFMGSRGPGPTTSLSPSASIDDQVRQLFPHHTDEDLADDPYAQTLHAIASSRAAQPPDQAAGFMAWKAANPGVSPADALDVLKYSEASGKPAKFVADNLDVVRKTVDASSVDWAQVSQKAPALRDFLLENSIRVPAVKEDLKPLTALEWAITDPAHALAQAPLALWDAVKGQEGVLRKYAELRGWYEGEAADAAIEKIEAENGARDYGVRSPIGKAILGVPKMAPVVLLDMLARWVGGEVGAYTGAPAGEAGAAAVEVGGGGLENPAADVGAFAAQAAPAVAGAELGSFGFNTAENAADIFWEAKKLKGADGQPIPIEIARNVADIGGAITGGLMALAGGPLASRFARNPVAKEVLQKAFLQQTQKTLLEGGTAAMLSRYAQRYGAHWLSGAVLMAGQAALAAGSQEAAKTVAGQGFEAHWENVLHASWEGLKTGLQDMPFLAAFSAARDVHEELGRARADEASANQLRAISDSSDAVSSLHALPTEMQQLVQGIKAQQGAAQSAYVDKGAWNRLWQGQKTRGAPVDPREAWSQIVGDGGEGYDKATGDDLVMPLEKYVPFARTDQAKALLDDTRLYSDRLSPRARREYAQQLDARGKELAKLPPEKMEESARKVYDDFRKRAEAAGQGQEVSDANARIFAAQLQALAERFTADGKPTDAWQIRQGYEFSITGPRGRGFSADELTNLGETETEKAKAGAAAAPAATPVRDAVRASWDKLGETDEGNAERMKRFFTDRTTGLYNDRGYKARQRDPARPFTAELGIEGMKHLNDAHGHTAVDNALKVLAQVTRAQGIPDAVRTSGTIKMDVRDPQHAQDIAKAAQDALGGDVKVTVGAGQPESGKTSPDDYLQAGADAHNAAKDAARADGQLAHRKAPALSFTADENGKQPTIDWENADQKSPEVKKVIDAATERSRPFVKRLADAKAAPAAEITEAHQESYAEHLEKHDPFDTVHFGPEGLLTEEGFHQAVEHATEQAKKLGAEKFGAAATDLVPRLDAEGKPVLRDGKPVMQPKWQELLHVVSADARGIKGVNEAFGQGLEGKAKGKPTDEIMSVIAKALHTSGGDEFNVARPHGAGDEFSAVFVGSKKLVDGYFKLADDGSSTRVFWRQHGDVVILQRGVRIAHGIGPDFDTADREALPAAKELQHEIPPPERLSRDEFAEYSRVLKEWKPDRTFESFKLKHLDGEQFGRLERALRERGKHELVRVGRPAGGAHQGGHGEGPGGSGGGGAPAGEGGAPGEGQGGAGGGGDREDGLRRGGGAGGSGGAGQEERQLYVAPEVKVAPNYTLPTEAEMRRAEVAAANLRSPLRKAAAQDFLAFVRDYLAGRDVSDYGAVMRYLPRDLEVALADKYGVTDPRDGFYDTEALRHQSRGGERKRRTGASGNEAVRQEKAEQLAGVRGQRATKAEIERSTKTREMLDEISRERQAKMHGDDEGGGTLNQLGLPEGDESNLEQPHQLPEGGDLSLESRRGRGYVTFTTPEDGQKRRFDIQLLAHADGSTLAHETFHFMSEIMGDLAQRADAPADLKTDYATLVKWMGYDSHAQRVAEAAERKELDNTDEPTAEQEARLKHLTAKEERATNGWEQFLLEGKSPSVELVGPFVRFRNWLKRIYQGVEALQQNFRATHGEDIGLSDDVRAVFRRLLSSDEEIQRQQAAAEAQPFQKLFEGATPEERAAYQQKAAEATERAKTELYRRIAAADKEESNEFFRGERERLRTDVESELDKHPVFRALRYLQDGELPGGSELKGPDGKPYKLDRRALVDKYGAEFVRSMPRGIFGKDGVGADDLASLLGFDSGDAMVRALQASKPRGVVVEGEVEKRLEDLYGPALRDSPEALKAEAIDSLHNSAAVEKALLERRRLGKLINPDRAGRALDLEADMLKETADRLAAERTVGELVGGRDGIAGRYLRAERAAAKAAFEAAEAGDFNKALGHNETQLLNMFLWRRARDLRAELEKDQALLLRTAKDAWRSQLGKADLAANDGTRAYRDAHDAILQAIGMQAPTKGSPAPGLDALIEAAGKNAQELGFDMEALRQLVAQPKAWRDLTTAEAWNVVDAVTNIRKAANNQVTLELEGRRQTLDKFFKDAEAELAGLPKQARIERDKSRDKGILKGPKELLQWADASLMNMESLVDVLTAGNRDSVFHKLFIDGLLASRDAKERLGREFLAKLMTHWEKVPKALRDRLNEVVDLSDLPLPVELADASGMDAQGKVSLKYVLMIALNMGNAGNKERLLGGYGWKEGQVLRALDRVMPKEAWDWVQGVWDSLDSLYPHIARVEEHETGLPPDKVVATPIETRHGTYRGGYFPAKYDARTNSKVAAWQTEGAIANLVSPPSYGRAATRKGHAKERAAHFQDAIDLDWNVVPSHVAQVLHDVAYRAWVKDAARVIVDPRFRTLVDRHLGAEYTKQFDPWLKAVANTQADAVPANQRPAVRAIAWLRGRIATAALGLNLPVALTHLSYPVALASTGEVHPKFMAESVAKTFRSWGEQRSFALAQSPELRFRAEQVGGLLRKSFDEMGANTTPLERHVAELSFSLLEWGEKLTATPAWIARYRQETAGGLTHEEAVREADGMIRRYYVSKSTADVPAIIRDKNLLGGLFMFYGYMNKMWNVQRHWVRDLNVSLRDEDATGVDKLGASAKFAGKALALAITQGLFSEWLGGKGKEDDESVPGFLFRKVLVFQASLVPFLGQAVEGLLMGKQISVRQSPGLAVAQHVAQTVGEAAKGDGKAAWDALGLLGVFSPFTPLPTGAVVRPGKYLSKVAGGDERPRGALDVAGGVVYGSMKTHPSNPLTDAQSVVDLAK